MEFNKAYTYTKYADNGSIDFKTSFAIGQIPGRRQQALYLLRESTIRPVAYFKSAEDAELFQEIFRIWRYGVRKEVQ